MSSKKQITKDQHWIPRFYLSQFVDKAIVKGRPEFWVYETARALKEEKYEPTRQTPKSFANKNFFYETPVLPTNTIEDILQKIEDKFAKVLESKMLKGLELTEKDKYWVSLFIGTFETRTIASKENIDSFNKRLLEQAISLEKQYANGRVSDTHKKLVNSIDGNIAFAQQIAVAMEMNRWSIISDFQFLTIKEDSDYHFLTGNNPVCLYDMTEMNGFYGIAPLSPTVEVTVPLTPKITLFINNTGKSGYLDLSYNLNYVEEVNNRTLHYNSEFLISSKKVDHYFFERTLKHHRQSLILLNQADEIMTGMEERQKKKLNL